MAEAAKATLKEDLKEQSSTINYANEILNLLFSEDFLKMTTDRVEVMENIREKMDKVMNNLASSTESMYYLLVLVYAVANVPLIFCVKYWRTRNVK